MAINFEDFVIHLGNKGFRITKRGELTRNKKVEYAVVFNNLNIDLVVGLDAETLSDLKVFTLNKSGGGRQISLYNLGIKTLDDVVKFTNNNSKLLNLEFDNEKISKQIQEIVGVEGVSISYGSDGISYTGFVSEDTISYSISDYLQWKESEGELLDYIDLYIAYEFNDDRYINLTSVEDKQEFLEEVQMYLKRTGRREQSLEDILEDIVNYGEEVYDVEGVLKQVYQEPMLPEAYDEGITQEEPKELAAKVRKRLKKYFPNTKFTVKSTYSGGSTVTVRWEGYPIKSVVEDNLEGYRTMNKEGYGYGYVDPEDGKAYSGVKYFFIGHDLGDKLEELYVLIYETRNLTIGNTSYEDYTEYARGNQTMYRNSLRYEPRLEGVLDETSFNELYEEYKELFKEKFHEKLRLYILRGFGDIVIFTGRDYSRYINLDNEELVVNVKLKEFMLQQEIDAFTNIINKTAFMRAYNLKVQVNNAEEEDEYPRVDKKELALRRQYQSAMKAVNKDSKDELRLHRLVYMLVSNEYKVKPQRAKGLADRVEITIGKIKINASPMYISIDENLIYYKNREGDDITRAVKQLVKAVSKYKITEEVRKDLIGFMQMYEKANDLRKKV